MVSGDRSDQQSKQQPLHPPLQPPGAPPPTQRPAGRNRRIWLALAILAVFGVAVVFVLPRLVATNTPVETADKAAEPALSATENTDRAEVRRRAEQTLQQFLQLQAALQRDNAAVWAEVEWNTALQQARDGDRQFGERRFDQAAQQYASALAGLQTLQASRATRLQQALAAGWQALSDNDASLAAERFRLALAIEADHAEAQQGLARAQARPEVLQQTALAESAELGGDWAAARDAYRAALELDREYSPAAVGLERADQQYKAELFNGAMDEALRALDKGRLAAAETALQQAATIKPDAPVLRDARQRLSDARQRSALAGLRRGAADEARAENWQNAIGLYQRALKIDANAGFARRGLEQAEQRAALNQQFDRYLNDPQRLYSPEPLANAQRLLEQVPQAPASEPRLANKVKRLATLISAAQQPVGVQLRSDGETEVVVYRVGRLGRFTHRQLELRPGTYTVVGSRAGYRDVRREFRVQAGQPPAVIDIRCEEPV
jgi:tetratricopeptide (TPR) repeat protein